MGTSYEKEKHFEVDSRAGDEPASKRAHLAVTFTCAGAYQAKTEALKKTVTNIFDLNFHHFHRLTKNHISFL